MIILTDVDDTLVNWVDGFLQFLSKKQGKRIFVDWSQPTLYEGLGISFDELISYVKEFNMSGKFGQLEPAFEAEKFIPDLIDAGNEFVAISACGTSAFTRIQREQNLRHLFGEMDIFCTPLLGDKTAILGRYSPTIYVEDSYKNAKEGLECGHTVFILRRHTNRHYESHDDNMIWVDSWKDIYDAISINSVLTLKDA